MTKEAASPKITLDNALHGFLQMIQESRSANTARTYANALELLRRILVDHGLPPERTEIEELPREALHWFLNYLKNYSPNTERLYLTALYRFYEFLAAEYLLNINLPGIRLLIHQRARRYAIRLPQFPRIQIEDIISYAIKLIKYPAENEQERLRLLRDRAFLITLADTGLRVHETCNLRRGDIDWNESKAVITGKGNQQAVIRFSRRSLLAIRNYLTARAQLDGGSHKPLPSLALFARHDKGSGKKVIAITTTTGRNIVSEHVAKALGAEAVGTITPHSFRHYFVTTVLRGSGGNLKLAQELARHRNIAVTQRYAHISDDELDKSYEEIFNE